MRPFLDRLSELLLQRHPDDLGSVAVVLPGKRAGLHLRRYLAKKKGGPLWSPEIMDMGVFLQRLAAVEQGDTMELLFKLYDTYRGIRGLDADPLDTFLEWAPTTLRDMSEVDAHLIDHAHFYKDLRDYHELEEWSFRLGELSPLQQRTAQEWRATGELHRTFNERMAKDRIGTSGYVARVAAEQALQNLELPWRHVWFAGLNALDPATTRIIARLQEQGMASVAWDADPFYLDDPIQESGRFLRRSIKELGMGELLPQAGILEKERRIRKVVTANALAQTVHVAQRLHEMSPVEREGVAIVLGQEHLLLPLLHRLPADIGPVNVTMGIQLSTLPVQGLVDHFLDLQERTTDHGIAVDGLLALFTHPYLKDGTATQCIIDGLNNAPHATISRSELEDLIDRAGPTHGGSIRRMIETIGDPTRIDEGLSALFDRADTPPSTDPFVREQITQMRLLQLRLGRLLARSNMGSLPPHAYRIIRERLMREERISFLGEPLKGLQVMGMLETRTVDHDHLIILGMNEGDLPRTDITSSWIPFDLRRHHGLPLPADAEAVTAYNFQRAMHLASDVEWTFSIGDGSGSNEPSRFISQWEHEVIGRSRTTIEQVNTTASTIVRKIRPIAVPKTEDIQRHLRTLCEGGLSPSALGTWLRCPLDFYFRYIARVKDQDPADGRLGSDILGNAVHNALQQLLSPYLGLELLPTHLAEAREGVHAVLRNELAKELPRAALDHGHYRLRREMAAKAICDHLQAEEERCAKGSTRILAIEATLQAELTPGIRLKGRLDRIDLRDGRLTILDVKTGSVNERDLQLGEIAREQITPERTYALQLLVYLFTYLMQHPGVDQASAAIIPLQRPSQMTGGSLRIAGAEVIHRSQLPAIKALLSALVDEMCDPNVPFTHREASRYCKVCVS